jgi:hypothetical protein
MINFWHLQQAPFDEKEAEAGFRHFVLAWNGVLREEEEAGGSGCSPKGASAH